MSTLLLNPGASARLTPLKHLIFTPSALAALKPVLHTPGFDVSPGVVVGQRMEEVFLVVDTVGGQVMVDCRGWPLPVVAELAYAHAWRLGEASARALNSACGHWGWWVHLDGVSWNDLRPPPPVLVQILKGAAWTTSHEVNDPPELATLMLSTVRRGRLLARGFRVTGTDAFNEVDVTFQGGDLRL